MAFGTLATYNTKKLLDFYKLVLYETCSNHGKRRISKTLYEMVAWKVQKMKIYQIDAFTNEYFKGNPAGVCILADSDNANDLLLQNIAAEMNLSETAFLVKKGDEYNLRWFTPETEVIFCGHATLSAAHVLWSLGLEDCKAKIIFNTKSGQLFARKINDYIELDFPSYEVYESESNDLINESFGIKPLFIGTDERRYLIEILNYSDLVNIKPDYEKLKKVGRTAFMITCRSENNQYDFYSRYFAPSVGINEDPVTGSAHSYLVPYWSKKLNKRVLNAYQASKRGGEIQCELTFDNRVLLRGKAVTIFEIEMKK